MNKKLSIVVTIVIILLVGFILWSIIVTEANKGMEQAQPKTPAADMKVFTLEEVALHSTQTDCYSVINGIVYDLTETAKNHPGGSKAIESICGKDGSAAFNAEHERKAQKGLKAPQIGTLVEADVIAE